VPKSEGPRDQAARPALATTGALVLAVALLQIGQQAIGAFSPRPTIQASLVIAVGLAALTAERIRATGPRALGKVGVLSGVVCVAALAVTGVIWATSGFSTPPEPSIGAQVDRIRNRLRSEGYAVINRELDLQSGHKSYLFIASKPKQDDANAPLSDEVLLYDTDRGTLKRELDLRPTVTDPDLSDAVIGTRFTLASVYDLDGDGEKELVGSWDSHQAGVEWQRIPVLISRQRGGRYAVTPLLTQASLHRAHTKGLPTYGFAPSGRPSSLSVWVSDLALDTKRAFLPRDGTLVTSVVTSNPDDRFTVSAVPADAFGRRVRGIPRVVRFWNIDLNAGRPETRPLCLLNPPVRRPPLLPVPQTDFDSARYLKQPLASAMRSAGLGLGDWHDGFCDDPVL
jgi:hypothetical protein